MPVVTTNLIQGPAELWVASFGTAEPAETAAGITGDPGAGWTAVGGTTDGVNINIAQEYAKMKVDQLVDRVGSRLTDREFTIETQMAEGTLDNMSVALNAGAVTTGTGTRKLSPVSGSAATQPTYRAIIVDGWAPEETVGTPLRRRIIFRKVLSTEGAEFAYNLEDMTVLAVTFTGHYVSASILPFVIIDSDPA